MKKRYVIFVSAVLLGGLPFTSCKKNTKGSLSGITPQILYGVELPKETNPKLLRWYSQLQQSDFAVALINNPNFGIISSRDRFMISGSTDPDDQITIKLNDQLFSASANGQWLKQDSSLSKFYGRNVRVSIRSENKTVKNFEMYVPAEQVCKPIPQKGFNGIDRVGSNLIWTPDPRDKTGYILLRYRLSFENGDDFNSVEKMIKNNGHFNLDEILVNPQIRSINFTLVSGNAVSTEVNGKTIMFYIQTSDHHEYRVGD